ncbi:MAG: hypothetical protein R3B72_51625 [Polyangiaceae bacterium]
MAEPNHRRFRPWVGDHYEAGLFGARLLLVGESHYGPASQDADPDFTVNGIHHVIAGSWNKLRFFPNLQRCVDIDSRVGTDEGRRAFWHKVAFCNYIQRMVATGPNVAPSAAARHEAREPLAETLRELAPEAVVLASKRMFGWVRRDYPAGDPLLVDDTSRVTLMLPSGGAGHALATFLKHPTRGGFRKQHRWTRALLQRVREGDRR